MSTDVATIAALRASTLTDSHVFVEGYYAAGDQGGGDFVSDPADTTSPDDGAVVIVTSAGLRYKRQWNGWFDWRWAGAVGDGVGMMGTDNAPAINRFSHLARTASSSGKGFNLFIPPGQYNYDATNCGWYWLCGIMKLHIQGYGATIQNTYSGASSGYGLTWSQTCVPLVNSSGTTIVGIPNGSPLCWFIQSTAMGDTQITMVTPTDAAAFAAGDPILIASLDLQYLGGFPPNTDQFEYHTVISSDSSTGIVVVDGTIKYQHLSTFPDGNNVGYPCGKARAWKLSAPSRIYDPLHYPALYTLMVPWQINHIYEGITINKTPSPSSFTYMSTIGKSIQFINCTTIGISPTIASTVIYKNHVITDICEPDKLVEQLVLDNVVSPKNSVFFQSSSINNVRVIGGKYYAFNAGTAKYVSIENADIYDFEFNAAYGANRSVNVIGGAIRNITYIAPQITGTPLRTIDGTAVTYANGIITVPKTGTTKALWGAIPGMTINLATSGNGYSGDAGTGIVTGLTEDSTNIYIATTWPFPSLPSWAGTGVRFSNVGSINFLGVYGCDNARAISDATKHGARPWEYLHAQFTNFQQTGGRFAYSAIGSIEKIVANVRWPSSVSTAKFILYIYLVTDDLLNDQRLLALTINANLKGERIITKQASSGMQSGDTLVFGSTAVTTLPTGRLNNINVQWSVALTLPATPAQNPMIDLQVFTYSGQYSEMMVNKVDTDGHGVTYVNGLLP